MAAEELREHAPVPEQDTLVFEQPLSERMRTFLRLDFLYSQALYHNEVASQWGSRAAMSRIWFVVLPLRRRLNSACLAALAVFGS